MVKKKSGDAFYLDIGCASLAALNPLTGFEGASKKNRPDIRLKDVIFAAIAQADPGAFSFTMIIQSEFHYLNYLLYSSAWQIWRLS